MAVKQTICNICARALGLDLVKGIASARLSPYPNALFYAPLRDLRPRSVAAGPYWAVARDCDWCPLLEEHPPVRFRDVTGVDK